MKIVGVADDCERLVSETVGAPWLPPGGTAEVWAGADCAGYKPAVIVRLLLTRPSPAGEQFFTTVSAKGDDLPTLFLGPGHNRRSVPDGLAELINQVTGHTEARTRCVGYVRNVVPTRSSEYPHPTPHAHVPVFTLDPCPAPVVDGSWHTARDVNRELRARHWWPIVEHHLEQPR